MQRTTVMLPHSLKLEAQRLARERRVSLGDLVREALALLIDRSRSEDNADPLFADSEVWEGEVPEDLSVNHDAYLYGEKA